MIPAALSLKVYRSAVVRYVRTVAMSCMKAFSVESVVRVSVEESSRRSVMSPYFWFQQGSSFCRLFVGCKCEHGLMGCRFLQSLLRKNSSSLQRRILSSSLQCWASVFISGYIEVWPYKDARDRAELVLFAGDGNRRKRSQNFDFG